MNRKINQVHCPLHHMKTPFQKTVHLYNPRVDAENFFFIKEFQPENAVEMVELEDCYFYNFPHSQRNRGLRPVLSN